LFQVRLTGFGQVRRLVWRVQGSLGEYLCSQAEINLLRTVIKAVGGLIDVIALKSDRRRVAKRIEALADDPRPPGCKELSGSERYRVRQGSYRILYAIEDDELIVYVVKVGGRKSVYRGL